MRSGLSTILQTLTPEAASVLNNSISEAGRRNHGQTTPLHVAATLLAAPTGFLRQACIRSHPNSSHPLQCRALELCFSVALERLPTSTASPASTEPPISNALTAALKRAQAHQRRGCPEQQQQPLLAVKVELEQLIISILDDPSVSRVMREASFSSPAVKATIEQSLNATVPGGNHLNQFGFRPSPPSPANHRNLYLNPRLQQQGISCINQPGHQRNDDVKKVMDIMSKSNKKNPILVGESEPEAIRKEILRRIEKGELATESELRNAQVISIEKEFESVSDKSQIPAKIKELGDLIEARIDTRCIVIDLSDLKWVVEQPPTAVASDVGRESVAEMAKLVAKFGSENRKLWLIGTATCETYLRCQIYHPSMEIDWDLQALPIASRSPLPGMFPRMGTNGILGSSVESLNPLKNLTTTAAPTTPFCTKCSGDYEHELTKLNHEFEKRSIEAKSNLPRWMLNAKSSMDESQVKEQEQDSVLRERIQELKRKWSDTCSRIHPSYSRSRIFDRMERTVLPMTGLYKPNKLLNCREPRLQPMRTVHEALRLNPNQETSQKRSSESHVTTDLALGPKEVPKTVSTKSKEDLTVKDLLGCISSEPQAKGKFVNAADAESFKRLLKGLMRKVWWQPEAASAIATTVTQCRSGGGGSRGSVWLLFAGPDHVGKTKMASVLAEHVCGADLVTISLGSRRGDGESELGFRGKTVLDRIVEAVRRNPSSVIVLADVDEADTIVRASLKRAMERGRLTDSHGREVSLGNIMFVLTGDWSTANPDEHRLHMVATGRSQLRLTIGIKTSKRRPSWLHDHDSSTKPRKKTGLELDLSLDLNLAVDAEEDRADGSLNSSDLTIEHEDIHGLENRNFAVTSVPHELVSPSDGAIVFKPVHFGLVRREIERTIKNAFLTVVDEKLSMEVEEAVLENLLGGLWFGKTGLEEWAEDVLIPSFRELKARLPFPGGDVVVRMEPDRDSGPVSGCGDWLPGKITVVVDGV